jgi:hypothetical protein
VIWDFNNLGPILGTEDLYGRLVYADGTLFGPQEVPIAAASIGERFPAVAYDPTNQRFMMAWEGGVGGVNVLDIYGLLFTGPRVHPCDADGNHDVDLHDALAVLWYLLRDVPLEGDGECDGDDDVTWRDVLAILRASREGGL